MSLIDILREAESRISANSPALAAIEQAASTVVETVASVVPGVAPVAAALQAGEAALNVAVDTASTVISSVENAAENAVSSVAAPNHPEGNVAPAGVTPFVDPATFPVQAAATAAPLTTSDVQALTPIPPVVDAATLAVGSVSGDNSPEALAARIATLETSVVSLINGLKPLASAFNTIAKEVGL
ncbi:MAG: hypothetical protein KGL39_27555 [Patescibacteria group bacterium]|nr:hypothetical protein [Patescibacteria group bacterium]